MSEAAGYPREVRLVGQLARSLSSFRDASASNPEVDGDPCKGFRRVARTAGTQGHVTHKIAIGDVT
jgi:hypothetical protein